MCMIYIQTNLFYENLVCSTMSLDFKYPFLFWSTLIGVIIVLLVTIKFIHEFWCSDKASNGAKVNIRLKLLTIAVTSSTMIRFIFQMSGYAQYNIVVSLTGSCIAYLSGFLFYLFIAYRLLANFKGTSYEIPKWRFILMILILFLNMIYGMWSTLTWDITEHWTTQNQIIISTIYDMVAFLMIIWILIAFNSRLYKLILLTPNEFGAATEMTMKQRDYIHLITRQTLLISFILIYILIGFSRNIIFAFFSALEYSKLETIEWRFIVMIRRVLTIILIYLSFPFNLSNKIYNIVCKPFHWSCYKCCGCIVKRKLQASTKRISMQGAEEYKALEDLDNSDNPSRSF